jgi:hypothetical protein
MKRRIGFRPSPGSRRGVVAVKVAERDRDEAVAFQLAIGPAGEVYREAGKAAEQLHRTLVAALKDELRPYARPEGVMMDSSSWMVSARNPGLR